MSLASYTDLLASVASWMNRTDLTAVIPDFVTIAEGKLARDLRLRKQLIRGSTLTTLTTTRAVSLPSDWLAFENLTILNSAPLTYLTLDQMDMKYPEGGFSGTPFVYTIEGDSVLFGPTPDSAYTVNIDYYARFPALASASTNWLLTNYPNIYLYGCLREGALFTKNPAESAQWDGLYKNEIQAAEKLDSEGLHSGSVLVVKRK